MGNYTEIPLRGKWGKGQSAIIDTEDISKVKPYLWRLGKNGYVASFKIIDGKTQHFLMHRHILGLDGSYPFIDHINDNKLDNRKHNLRLCTNKQNVSRKKKMFGFTSPYKGVCWNKRIGTFESIIEAAQAYNKKASELFGDFSRLNNA